MFRASPALLAALLIGFAACHQEPSSPLPPSPYRPPDGLSTSVLGTYETTILVRVVESLPRETFPPEFNSPKMYVPVRGRVLVLKSWWGPFSAGQVLQVIASVACGDTIWSCTDYPLKVGDELLIVTQSTNQPIFATLSSNRKLGIPNVVPGSHSTRTKVFAARRSRLSTGTGGDMDIWAPGQQPHV